ncbi:MULTISPECIES: DNA circularization N-terminal domain-containing protein [Escherichia]|uniref:DNA circularization N-terminal domain-containing protein n=1 Tax=Escherichia TaxID=561 RepID=UPI0005C567B1|nr:DNA circularization N-terminal domain-containing protein [Escherichia coli]
MTWKDRLQDASFRGVPFKVEEESAGTGRRVETHEYPQGELKVSRISEAISGANGEYSHQLLAPADNISIAKNELAVLGTISWT